jgi:ferric-dicitrate binding protein FerR (iron transport regulator)
MLKRDRKNNIDKSFSEFIEFRSNLSETDKKIEAGLLIEDIKSVNIDDAYVKVERSIDNHRTYRIDVVTWITRIAAMLAIPLLILNIWYLNNKGDEVKVAENNFTLQEISSPIGMKTHIVLPDGSDVWLNADSKISYKIPFVGETRKVTLFGEAFLKVIKNEKSPFILSAGKTQVKVFGTQFNVKSYPEDNKVEVALKEGSVRFYFINSHGKKVFTQLQPDDYLVLNKSNKKVAVKKEKLDKYILWHKDILIFDETPIEEVAKTLERWYGVTVIIDDDEIKNYKFTTVFENEPLSRVLELLELTSPISIKYKSGKINRATNKLNKSIVTISKK